MSLAHPFFSFSRKGAFFILVLSGLLLLLLAILSLLVPAAHAGQVTVAWDPNPEPEVAGYKIYYGTSPGSYTSSLDAGNATSIVISGLRDGATYFFSAVAYDASNNESGFSNEITYAVPAVRCGRRRVVIGRGGVLHRHGRLRQLPGAGSDPPAEVPGPHPPGQRTGQALRRILLPGVAP